MSKEMAVRQAAILLQEAITDARGAGLVVVWPSRPEDLGAIAISESGKVVEAAPSGPAEEAVYAGGKFKRGSIQAKPVS